MPDLLIPPMSTRMHEGFVSKNSWLETYFEYRRSISSRSDQEFLAKRFLSAIGKNNSDLANRFRGCFLGLAVGDAFGTTLEFSERPVGEVHREMIGKGPFNLKAGEWTDDTSMALCLAHSLYERKYFDPEHQMDLYTAWWKEGFLSSNGRCFDIGNTVSAALEKYSVTGDGYAGSEDEYSAGNGSLMRLCPVVMFYFSNLSNAIKYSGVSSKTTHANEQAVDCCRFFSALIIGAFRATKKEELLSSMYSPIESYWEYFPLCERVKNVAEGSYKKKCRDEIDSSGYVVSSLEAALWAFYNTDSFESGLIKAVNLGGDADTIGAIYGQLAGAFYGELGIPFKFIDKLVNPHYFYFFSDEFVSGYSGRDELMRCK
ncbi:ADP-ribosylglycohydrolase family protein [Microbulbifer harenosus]|nr:ADP-ribosylglycohydrolase family protein [Microbulbifer harenosus]